MLAAIRVKSPFSHNALFGFIERYPFPLTIEAAPQTRPRADLAAIRAFIDEDSPHYAAVVLSRLIAATERLAVFPESGRSVPEFQSPVVGEVLLRPYRRRFSIGPPRPMVSP
jgi:plasmid stabilization system protein ParE